MTQPYDPLEETHPRQTLVRGVLFLVILGTLPFYVLGFVLWGTAPDNANAEQVTPTATNTIIGDGGPSLTPTLRNTGTPFPTISPLNPTPLQFITPNIPPTIFIPPTIVIPPTGTNAPTLTPFPTNTVPPTLTPIPTNTIVVSTNTPLPTATFLAPPSDTPLPPPTNTPVP